MVMLTIVGWSRPTVSVRKWWFLTILLIVVGRIPSISSAWTSNNLVPIFFDSTNHRHRDIQYHPEQPARIDACVDALVRSQLVLGGIQLMDLSEDDGKKTDDTGKKSDTTILHSPCTPEELEHAQTVLLKTHDPQMVVQMEQTCQESRQRRIDNGKNPLGFIGYIDDDTYMTTESYDVALRAMVGWIRAINHVLQPLPGQPDTSANRKTNPPPPYYAMALTRPPGHHATYDTSNGFCLFNFAAAAAIHAMERDPELKISIFDWDVHYGQGIADIIQHYDRARYVSIHQSNAFPFMGNTRGEYIGRHKNILTLPIAADTTWSCGYEQTFQKDVLPFLQSDDDWMPNLILICAGYDALDSDELANVSLYASDFGTMTRNLIEHTSGKIPIVIGLEGGYQLKDSPTSGNLPDAVLATVQALVVASTKHHANQQSAVSDSRN